MTQNNPHNKIPKDTVEELIAEFKRINQPGEWDLGYSEQEEKYKEIADWLRIALTTAYNKGVEVGREMEREIVEKYIALHLSEDE